MFHIFTSIKVRFADCDMFGHVNNAKFITYMEQARVEYFKNFPEINFLKKKEMPEFSFILAEITCTFKSPAYLDETLNIKIRSSELKNSSFIMEYEITEEKTSRLVATGKSVAVAYNYKDQKVIPIPDSMRKKFEEIEKRKF